MNALAFSPTQVRGHVQGVASWSSSIGHKIILHQHKKLPRDFPGSGEDSDNKIGNMHLEASNETMMKQHKNLIIH